MGIILIGRLAYSHYLACKVERLAGHGVIEIHLHLVAVYRSHDADEAHSVVGHHGNLVADRQQPLLHLTVHFERGTGQFNHHIGIGQTVTVLRGERKLELLPGTEAIDVLLEFGQQVSCTEHESERILGRSRIGHTAVHGKRIAQRHKFLFSDFHFNNYYVLQPFATLS